MSKQPEALRLADGNDECAKAWLDSSDAHKFRKDTAAELRRLHEANAELLEALRGFVSQIEWGARISGTEGYLGEAANTARAAIAKATGATE